MYKFRKLNIKWNYKIKLLEIYKKKTKIQQYKVLK